MICLNNFQNTLRFHSHPGYPEKITRNWRNLKDCVFCFYGHNRKSFRALHKFGKLYEIQRLHNESLMTHIISLFHTHGKFITHRVASIISVKADYHPFLTRLLAWHSFMLTRKVCTKDTVQEALEILMGYYQLHYHKCAENLTRKQIQYLHALNCNEQKLCSREILDKYELGKSNNVSRVLDSLIKKEILEKTRKHIYFTDPFFSMWLDKDYFT